MRAHRFAILAICAAPLFAACAVGAHVPSTDSASPAVVTIVTRAAVDSGFDTWRKPADPTVDWNGIALAVLPYGSTLLVNTFRCDSATTGVTCQNQSTGHGFFMSREKYRFF